MIQIINPLSDSRWNDLAARHPKASVFHQSGWLEALSRTYGYEPCVLTSAPADEPLEDGVVLCRVSSWITGNICARSRRGKFTVHVRTMRKRLRRSLTAVAQWCQEHRHEEVEQQQKTLNAKLRGHYQYYGRPTNFLDAGRPRSRTR